MRKRGVRVWIRKWFGGTLVFQVYFIRCRSAGKIKKKH